MTTFPSTRRGFLRDAAALSLAAALPAYGLARKDTAPSEKITLGVIGIGPRCTYDLKSMLALTDIRSIAIAEAQAKRREAGKKLVDDHYDNKDCEVYRAFRDL